jgi:hypothetical protein
MRMQTRHSRKVALYFALQLGLPGFHSSGLLPSAAEGAFYPLNLVVEVEGSVSFKQKGWTNYAPLAFGIALRSGDLLKIPESAHAKVVCSDLTVHKLESGVEGIPCAGAGDLLRSAEGSLINPTRGWSYDGSYPMVISPRKTKLLNANPILRWNSVPNASYYRITVRGQSLLWSSNEIPPETELIYPESAPPLKPGEDYKLIVETQDKSSSSEPGLGLGFSLMDGMPAVKVEAQELRIKLLGLGKEPTEFLIAHLYASLNLNAESIERLENLSKTFKAAEVERLLGDLYLKVGLPRKAETCYLEALQLSVQEKDEVGEMKVHLAMAEIYERALGNVKLATEEINLTLALAGKIGDDQTAHQAGLLLAEVKKGGT